MLSRLKEKLLLRGRGVTLLLRLRPRSRPQRGLLAPQLLSSNRSRSEHLIHRRKARLRTPRNHGE